MRKKKAAQDLHISGQLLPALSCLFKHRKLFSLQ